MNSQITPSADASAARATILKRFSMNRISDQLAGNQADVEELLGKFTSGTAVTAAELLKEAPAERRRRMFLSILWASKMGLLRLGSAPSAKPPSGEQATAVQAQGAVAYSG